MRWGCNEKEVIFVRSTCYNVLRELVRDVGGQSTINVSS